MISSHAWAVASHLYKLIETYGIFASYNHIWPILQFFGGTINYYTYDFKIRSKLQVVILAFLGMNLTGPFYSGWKSTNGTSKYFYLLFTSHLIME